MAEPKEGVHDHKAGDDGAHSHRLPIHYCYDLGPYDAHLFVIYHYKGRGTFDLHFSPMLSDAYRDDPNVAVFKLPAKNKAVFELDEVWQGHTNVPGRYKATFMLLPAPAPADVRELTAGQGGIVTLSDTIPPSICTKSAGECAGTYSPCGPGQVIKKVDGVCGCYNPEGG